MSYNEEFREIMGTPNLSKFETQSPLIRSFFKKWRDSRQSPLHDYQVKAINAAFALSLVDEYMRINSRQEYQTSPLLIVAPAGCGKTGMILFLPYMLASKRVLILTPSRVIREQISREMWYGDETPCFLDKIKFCPGGGKRQKFLESFLEDVRVVRSNTDIQTQSKLVIVNAQKFGGKSGLSLVHEKEEVVENVRTFFQKFDTLIVDEAHHYPAKTWINIVKEFGRPVDNMTKKIIFLTATPYRRDRDRNQKPIIPLHRVAYTITTEEVEGITTRKCVFQEEEDKTLLLQHIRKILRENEWRERRFALTRNPVHQVMILVRLRVEALDLVKQLNSEAEDDQFAVTLIQGQTTNLEDFTAGKYRVAVTCGVGVEGYDNSNVVDCVIMKRIVTARILFQQFMGRCIRLKKDLPGNVRDESVAVLLSYKEFGQKKMWNSRNEIAEMDPVEIDVDEGATAAIKRKSNSAQKHGKEKRGKRLIEF